MKLRDTLSEAVRAASKGGEPALVAFLTAGFPKKEQFREHLRAVAAGADVVEIGVPFTDPMADGVTCWRRALCRFPRRTPSRTSSTVPPANDSSPSGAGLAPALSKIFSALSKRI